MMLLMILLTAERHFIYSTVNLSNVQLIRDVLKPLKWALEMKAVMLGAQSHFI